MSNPYFFLHIPKTAGSTLNAILDDNFDPVKIFDIYTDDERTALRNTTYDGMAQYDLIRGHFFIRNFTEILDGPLPFQVFTFLREPVARVISEYHFLKSWPKSHLYDYLNKNKVTLAEYVTSDAPELRWRGCNTMVNSLSGIGYSLEEGLDMAWHHLSERFIFFGLLERFDESILILSKHLELGRSFYERQNVRARPALHAVTPDDVELIQEHNQADIALYDMASLEFDNRVKALGPGFKAEVSLFTKVNERFQRVTNLIMERDGLQGGDFVNGK